MKLRKVTALVLAAVMTFSLAACGATPDNTPATSGNEASGGDSDKDSDVCRRYEDQGSGGHQADPAGVGDAGTGVFERAFRDPPRSRRFAGACEEKRRISMQERFER